MVSTSSSSCLRAFPLLLALLGPGLAACPPPASLPDTRTSNTETAQPAESVARPSTSETAPRDNTATRPPSTETAQPTESDAGQLTIGVWNMEWLSETEGAGHSPRTAPDYARLASYLPDIDADVLVLQEVESLMAVRRVFAEPEWNAHIADQQSNQRVAVVWRDGIQVQVLPDYEVLNTSHLREGVDFQVTLPGSSAPTVRVLGVHLKSGCFSDDYRTADSDACVKLATQVPLLEAWIDARASEGVPFMVVGDFNRRLQPADPFWVELDDQQPAGADLEMTYGSARPLCWNSRYDQFVDHLVLGGPAIPLFVANSFREFVYPAADSAFQDQISDHCPLMIDLTAP